MNPNFKSALVMGVLSSLLLGISGSPVQAQQFWSPRHVVLDTYTEPIPFRCGGEVLLAYELHITNMDRLTVALAEIAVLADDNPEPVKTYSQALLTGSLNRIAVTGQPEPVNLVGGGQRVILHIVLSYSDLAAVPMSLSHRITYSFLAENGTEFGAVVAGGAIRIARDREAIMISPPLGEGNWLAARGVSLGLSGHRGGAIRPQGGIPYQKARYAFDFVRFTDSGQAFVGERSHNEDWIGYGAEVLAVADGLVVRVQDGIPDSRPFDPERLQGLTGETLGGNYIVLDIGNDLYAFYGHLIPGSPRIREGDRIRRGEVIGQLGSSGNSDVPHLHFQINRAIPISGEAVPYGFEEYVYLGEAGPGWQIDPSRIVGETLARRRSARRSKPVSPGIAIADSIINQIFRNISIGSASVEQAWIRSLAQGGVSRVREMPGSKAVF